MTRIFLATVLAAGMSTALVGCGGDSNGEPPPVVDGTTKRPQPKEKIGAPGPGAGAEVGTQGTGREGDDGGG